MLNGKYFEILKCAILYFLILVKKGNYFVLLCTVGGGYVFTSLLANLGQPRAGPQQQLGPVQGRPPTTARFSPGQTPNNS